MSKFTVFSISHPVLEVSIVIICSFINIYVYHEINEYPWFITKMIDINPAPNTISVVAKVGLLPQNSLITNARGNAPDVDVRIQHWS